MITLVFEGRIFPECADITISNHPSLKWSEGDLSGAFHITISNSRILLKCEIEAFIKEQHLTTVYARALDIVRTSVNLVAFRKGLGVIAFLETFVDQNGERTPILLRDKPLAELCTAYSCDTSTFHDVLDIVLREPTLGIALRDLVWAVSTTHEIPASCSRAVETLRSLLSSDRKNRKTGWGEMKSKLNVSENYLKLLTDNSTGPRHGDHGYVPADVIRQIATRSWTLMNRFLEYRKGGNAPLSSTNFPLLDG